MIPNLAVIRSLARRRRPGFLAAATATATLVLTAGTAHADLGSGELESITDEYLFTLSLPRFVDVRADRPHADQLDWSSDSCSWSPDKPFGFEFGSGCDRHDFGYRNYKRQQRFTEEHRHAIDDNFKADMYSSCGPDPAHGELVCKATANLYYFAVREFGATSTSTADAINQAEIRPRMTASGEVAGFRATNRAGETVEFGVPR